MKINALFYYYYYNYYCVELREILIETMETFQPSVE